MEELYEYLTDWVRKLRLEDVRDVIFLKSDRKCEYWLHLISNVLQNPQVNQPNNPSILQPLNQPNFPNIYNSEEHFNNLGGNNQLLSQQPSQNIMQSANNFMQGWSTQQPRDFQDNRMQRSSPGRGLQERSERSTRLLEEDRPERKERSASRNRLGNARRHYPYYHKKIRKQFLRPTKARSAYHSPVYSPLYSPKYKPISPGGVEPQTSNLGSAFKFIGSIPKSKEQPKDQSQKSNIENFIEENNIEEEEEVEILSPLRNKEAEREREKSVIDIEESIERELKAEEELERLENLKNRKYEAKSTKGSLLSNFFSRRNEEGDNDNENYISEPQINPPSDGEMDEEIRKTMEVQTREHFQDKEDFHDAGGDDSNDQRMDTENIVGDEEDSVQELMDRIEVPSIANQDNPEVSNKSLEASEGLGEEDKTKQDKQKDSEISYGKDMADPEEEKNQDQLDYSDPDEFAPN